MKFCWDDSTPQGYSDLLISNLTENDPHRGFDVLNVLMFEEDSRPAFVLTEPMVSSDLIWVNCNLISADKSEYQPTERMGPSSDVLYLYAETTNLSAEQCLARFLVVQCIACDLFS